MLSYSHLLGHYMTLHHCCSCSPPPPHPPPPPPPIIVTINALGTSDGIQNLKITDLSGHFSFDSSEDPALLAGVDDTDDEDSSFTGVHDEDTSFAGVPGPNTTIMTNADNDSDAESDHISVDPNEANDNSSKSIHSMSFASGNPALVRCP